MNDKTETKKKLGSTGVEGLPAIILPSDDSAKMVQTVEVATYNTLMKVADKLHAAKLFPNAGSPEGVFAIVLYGHEHGIAPMTALNEIHVIHGKLGFSGQFIQAKIERVGLVVDVLQSDAEHCILEFSGRPGKKNHIEKFIFAEAKQAGLVKKGGAYETWPSEMMYWRCLTRGARRYAPDAILGMYHKDELVEIPPDFNASEDHTVGALSTDDMTNGDPEDHQGYDDKPEQPEAEDPPETTESEPDPDADAEPESDPEAPSRETLVARIMTLEASKKLGKVKLPVLRTEHVGQADLNSANILSLSRYAEHLATLDDKRTK